MRDYAIFRTYAVLGLLLIITFQSHGQLFTSLDTAPHDIVYFRAEQDSDPVIKVVYGRPKASSMEVFGKRIPFGKVWHTGSNESTEIQFYTDVMFGNKFVKAGKYVLYTIPNENYWTIILNGKTDTYGAHFYNPKFDVAKIEVPVLKGSMVENFSIAFNRQPYGTQMVLGWAMTRVKVPLYTAENLISKI